MESILFSKISRSDPCANSVYHVLKLTTSTSKDRAFIIYVCQHTGAHGCSWKSQMTSRIRRACDKWQLMVVNQLCTLATITHARIGDDHACIGDPHCQDYTHACIAVTMQASLMNSRHHHACVYWQYIHSYHVHWIIRACKHRGEGGGGLTPYMKWLTYVPGR